MAWSVTSLAIVEAGVGRVLHALGVTTGPAPLPGPETRLVKVEGEGHYLYAPASGVFEPCFRVGEEVQAGQLAGRLFNPYAPWEAPCELHFQKAGLAVCVRTFAGVEPGDCIALLASDARWQ